MRKVKEVLRLRFELGLGQREIARSCGMGLSTVHDYLERAARAGIGWPIAEGLGEAELEAKLFGNQLAVAVTVRGRPEPDWKAMHEQLQQHRHLTLQLLWQEYRRAQPEGYRYSWFCERYQQWRRHLDVVLRQEHKAEEKMFVDWAGATIPVYDATTGEAWPASLFVAIIAVAHSEDATGYPCGKDASARCKDCGTPICDVHGETCSACDAVFCATCLAFHNR